MSPALLFRHIFCLPCAETLGLSHPSADPRQCPACQTLLTNPDDAAMTILNPTEDYKTSVLSGLDPNTIMECAGRAMLFWTYQTTQEMFDRTLHLIVMECRLTESSLYQEFLGKTLTEKYATLNTQMDKIIHNANAEISTLQTRLQGSYTYSFGGITLPKKPRYATIPRPAAEEKPGAGGYVPGEKQEVHANHKPLQPAEVPRNAAADTNRCVGLDFSNVEDAWG